MPSDDHSVGDVGDEPLDQTDLDLLAELADLYTDTDPVPPGQAERMKIAMTVESLHAEVAELTELAGPMLVATRAETTAAEPGAVTFSGESVSLMIAESDPTSATVGLDGWVSPAGALVQVHRGDLVLSVRSDQHGRFTVAGLPRGSLWFVVWADGTDGTQGAGQGGPDARSTARPLVTPTVEF